MDTWAYHTGKLDADGNYVDRNDPSDDKYWQKYMSEDSPYKAKFSPPKIIKPTEKKKMPRIRKKKKPRWMTNEEYERLTIKSYSKKHVANKDDDHYFDNDGEIMRWPEILQQHANSPGLKRAIRAHSPKLRSKHSPPDDEDSNLDEIHNRHFDTMKGTYRPSSAPAVPTPTKNLFKKPGMNNFFNDLLVTPLPSDTATAALKDGARSKSRDTSPTGKGSRKLKLDDEFEEGGVEDEYGIVEYGDTYVIENEEEAINQIQNAMLTAVARSALSPQRNTSRRGMRSKQQQRTALEQEEEEQEKRIGSGIHISGIDL